MFSLTIHWMSFRNQNDDGRSGRASSFGSTHWSLVLAAGDRENLDSRRALAELCTAYWHPLFAYACRKLRDEHQAEDLTQAFFEQLLEKKHLAAADPHRGRFRAFLITAFKNFLSKQRDKARAQKRGGDLVHFSIDASSVAPGWREQADHLSADKAYERQWAITLLNQVMTRLQQESIDAGKGVQFEQIKGFLAGPGGGDYARAASALGVSEAAIRMAVSRLRARYAALLRQEISHTVQASEDVEDELRRLFEVFSDS